MMRKTDRIWAKRTLAALLAAGTCVDGGCSSTDGFSPEEWTRVKLIEPLATTMPANPYDDRGDDEGLARLGQKFFYDKDVAEAITVAGPSGNVGDVGKVGCVTCHDSKYFTDSRPFPQSHGRNWLTHNTPSMLNLPWFKWTLWVGTFDSLTQHGAGAWGASATPLAQAHFVYKKYRDDYNAMFPDTPLDPALDPKAPDAARFPATGQAKANATVPDGAFEKMAKADQWAIHQFRANMARIFDAYPRRLVTRNSRFEQYIHGDHSEATFSAQAKNGLKLFIGKASCIDCHNGPLLSDNQFHNVGVPSLVMLPSGSTTPAAVDHGRAGALTGQLINALATLKSNVNLTRMDPVMDQLAIFSGAGQFSSDPAGGLQRLVDLDNQLCMPGGRKMDAVPTVCGTLFKAPRPANPTATPPDLGDPGDPRYQTCLDSNTDGLCADLSMDATGKAIPVPNYDPSLEGAYRTPQLLNISETGPYFHTGEFRTLRDVVWHYNNGGGAPGSFLGTKSPRIRPLLLTDSEMDDLVEFLKTLTGDPPDPAWACNPLLGPPAGCGPPGAGATGGAGGSTSGGGGGGGKGAGGGGGVGGTTGGAGHGGAAGMTGGGAGATGTGGAISSGGATGTGGMGGGAGAAGGQGGG